MKPTADRWLPLFTLILLFSPAGCSDQDPVSHECAGDTDCVTPPNECLDENTYQAYEDQGFCNRELGVCEYQPLEPLHCPGCPECEDEVVEPLGPGLPCGQGLPPCEEALVCSSWNVCCDELCDEPCRSCMGEHTGGSDGYCGLVRPGPEPRSLCEDDFECDGAGGCVPPDDPSPVYDFDTFLVVDFDVTPTGPYLRSNWSADWGISEGAWSDPCRDQCSNEEEWAGAQLSILEEQGNRFMRHELTHKGTAPGTSGTQWWKGLTEHDELYLSYRIRFVGNDWVGTGYDGKLPGFCGGGSCPGGGDPPLNYEGFSTRYMFKNGTQGLFFYLYYAGMDTSSSNYGNSLYFDPYEVNVGEWHTIAQRLVMNTPGQANGIVEGFHNGVLVAQKTNMDYRNSMEQQIDLLVFANFLGGSGDDPSAAGHVPTLDFDDFVVFRFADSVEGVPRGRNPWPSELPLVTPLD